MILGVKSLNLSIRTTLPAIGLLVVIIIVFLAKDRLFESVDEISRITLGSPPTRHYRLSDMVRNNRRSTRMAAFQQPPTRYSDAKQGESTTQTEVTPPHSRSHSRSHSHGQSRELPAISGPAPGQSERGVGGLPIQGQLFPPMRPQPPPAVLDMRAFATPPAEQVKEPKRKKSKPVVKGSISGPILRDDGSNPLERIATVDLETAARADEERRAAHPLPLESHSVGSRGLSTLSSEELVQKSQTVGERKVVAAIPIIKTNLDPIIESGGASKTSSAQLSPGVENMRQRSPRTSQLQQQSYSRRSPPPLPPLKTPRTVANLAVPSPRDQPQHSPDVWDLLAVPKTDPEYVSSDGSATPEVPPRSPLRDQPPIRPMGPALAERPSTSPAAKSIATMTQTSQPDNTGRHRRSQSVKSRRSRPRDLMFTDARTPPPIPQKCKDRKSFLTASTVYVDPPPAYKFNGQGFTSPNRIPVVANTAEESHSPVSKPENKLSLFPPSYSKSGMDSPKQRAEAAVKAALAGKSAAGPAPLPVLSGLSGSNVAPRQRGRAHTTANGFANTASQGRSPIRTTTLITPIDKPLPASPSIPALVRESVLNRPRPVTRTPETARFLTSYTHKPNTHRRSVSTGSISTKKSIVHKEPLGSPSGLPPLPPIPAERSPVIQGSPSTIRSMTVEEKMTLLKRRSGDSTRKRRSKSVSEMPELKDIPLPATPPFLAEKGLSISARSTMSSVRTVSIFNMTDGEKSSGPRRATKTVAEPMPVAPLKIMPSQEQAPVPEEPKGVKNLLPPYPESPMSFDHGNKLPPAPSPPRHRPSESNETLEDTFASKAESSRDSWELESCDFDSVQGEDAFTVAQPTKASLASAMVASATATVQQSAGSPRGAHHNRAGSVDNSYHNRLGSSLPSFSSRQNPVNKSRRGPPPHPLLLNRPPKTLLIETEPSPLESPEHALDQLEEQLQKLERNSRTSSVAQEQRMTLLADLEKEMGLQESNWQNLRHTIIRDSLSTVNASPAQNTQLPSLWAKVLEQRGSGLLGDPRRSLTSIEGTNRKSQMGQAGNRLSLLTVSHPTSAQLGSPTPPDTDEEADIPMMMDEIVVLPRVSPVSLWRAEVPSPTILKQDASLWSPSASVSFVLPEVNSPAKSSRPSNRATEPLAIASTQLWVPSSKPKKAPPSGLWELPVPYISFDSPEDLDSPDSPNFAETRSKPRPVTVRPPRRPKRMTNLPDILESPKPLSIQHNTLGIFQFPWGEKSHTGAVPPPIFGAMPGTMTSGRGLGYTVPDPVYCRSTDNEGSFFNDADEEDVGDNFADFDDEEDDGDDFDETTLWEIASLLKSDRLMTQTRVVSGEWLNSVSGNRRSSVVASPTESCDSPQCATIPMVLDVEPKAKPALEAKKEEKTLWKNKSQNYSVEKGFGLRQPNRRSWEAYLNAAVEERRTKARKDEMGSVASEGLWTSETPIPRVSESLLWNPVADSHPVVTQQTQNQEQLWEVPSASSEAVSDALWSFAPSQRQNNADSKPVTGLAMRPIARKAGRDLPPTPNGTSLWLAEKEPVVSPDWMSTMNATAPRRQTQAQHPVNLWKAPSALPTARSDTLWSSISTQQQDVPSPKPLIGLAMRPLPRKIAQDLPSTPSATSLWSPAKLSVVSPNWISMSKDILTAEPSPVAEAGNSTEPGADGLWTRPELTPTPEPTARTWQPAPAPSPQQPGSPKLQPRYDRKPSVPAPAPEVEDIGSQTMWKRSSNVQQGQSQNWLDGARKHRTFQEDVETVQEYLRRRWGGM